MSIVNLPPAELAARLGAAVREATGLDLELRLGAEVGGYVNVGAELPRRRRTREASAVLRKAIARALEREGVSMAPSALAPRLFADVEGSVQVRELPRGNAMDASHFATPPPKR